MKMLLKSACIAFVITVIYSIIPFQATCENISNEVFRLHILANSDREEDQNLKLKVRDKVLLHTEKLFEEAQSREDAENIVSENLEEITAVAQKEIYANGYNYKAKSEVVTMYFTTRHYENYTLPSGMYNALRITIGSGKGKNWWCVMYPSICISAATQKDEKAREVFDDNEYDVVKNEKYQYKFKIVEIFEKVCSFF